jgi:phospholipid/cholesterol/gamma-HCH transport system substrate-binding protein
MNRETKIGILTVICIAGLFWGYKFLKGKNVLSRSLTIYAVFDKVEDLPISAPVLISGLQVGTVQDQYLKDGDPGQIVVVLDIERRIKLPKDAVVVMQATSLMGGKSIRLDYKNACTDNCAQSGDTLAGRHEGLLNTMVPMETLTTYMDAIRNNLGGVLDTLDQRIRQPDSPTAESVRDIYLIIRDLQVTVAQMSKLMTQMTPDLVKTGNNLNALSSSLAQESQNLKSIIDNVNQISRQVANAGLDSTITKADHAISSLDNTLVSLKSTTDELNQTVSRINKGEGSLGMLMKDPALYQNLNNSSKQLDLLLQDLRLNPKRYVHLSVFGKKQKDYALPEEDPAGAGDSQ